MDKITIVVPCYNEEETVSVFYRSFLEVVRKLDNIDYEILFVDDGSSDGTKEICKSLCGMDEHIHYISFSRNFGKEAALYAGLQHSKGNFVAVMDADLQDPPSLLPEMYGILKSGQGYDCVATRRVSRKGEPPIRSFFAVLFYRLINRISKTEIMEGARDFRLMTRRMVDAILSVSEVNRFSKGIFGWVGFQTKWLEYENIQRAAGKTKWSFWRLFTYSLDGIIAFSTVPLAAASVLGFLFCLAAAVWILVIIVKTLLWGDPVAGYPSLACLVLFMGGVQLLSLGIIGQYLAKAYLETKKRPIYIIQETDSVPAYSRAGTYNSIHLTDNNGEV